MVAIDIKTPYLLPSLSILTNVGECSSPFNQSAVSTWRRWRCKPAAPTDASAARSRRDFIMRVELLGDQK